MKKLLAVAVVVAGAGFIMWRKMSAEKSEQKLWSEATDKISS
jgi:hypothetical protein